MKYEVVPTDDHRLLEVRLPGGGLALVKVYPDEPRYERAQLNSDHTRRLDEHGAPMAPPPVPVTDGVRDTHRR